MKKNNSSLVYTYSIYRIKRFIFSSIEKWFHISSEIPFELFRQWWTIAFLLRFSFFKIMCLRSEYILRYRLDGSKLLPMDRPLCIRPSNGPLYQIPAVDRSLNRQQLLGILVCFRLCVPFQILVRGCRIENSARTMASTKFCTVHMAPNMWEPWYGTWICSSSRICPYNSPG